MKDHIELATRLGFNQSDLQVRIFGREGDVKKNLTSKESLVGFDPITLKSLGPR